MAFDPHNKIIIITAPSGAGKTSITHHLLEKFPQLSFSISAATRKLRGNERNGVDLLFPQRRRIQPEDPEPGFCRMGNGGMKESITARSKSELERIWKNKQVPVLDIDVKGAIHVQQQYPDTTLSPLHRTSFRG